MTLHRREFITLLGGAAAWPLVALAQQRERVRRIGMLINIGAASEGTETFEATLRSLDWIEGRNVEVDKRLIDPLGEKATQYAKELINLRPDVLVAGPTNAVLALQQETRTIPIVFVGVADAVEQGLVPSLSRPGGNITGFSSPTFQIVGKGLQLFHEIAPDVTRLEALFGATSPVGPRYFRAAEMAARSLAIKMTAAPVQNRAEIEHSVLEFGREPNGGLYLPPDTFTGANRDLIIDLAARYNLPTVSGRRSRADAGGVDVL